MVLAWYMDDSESDKREEHHQNPQAFVSLEELKTMTGVMHCKLDPEIEENKLNHIREKRGYSYSDLIEVSPEKLPNYDEKLKSFYEEHLHKDEEVRYVLAGSGYFDVRDNLDKWIRILVETGDLLIVPAGIYHRFTLCTNNYIKARRYFVGEPVWTPFNRPEADSVPERQKYQEEQSSGFPSISLINA